MMSRKSQEAAHGPSCKAPEDLSDPGGGMPWKGPDAPLAGVSFEAGYQAGYQDARDYCGEHAIIRAERAEAALAAREDTEHRAGCQPRT